VCPRQLHSQPALQPVAGRKLRRPKMTRPYALFSARGRGSRRARANLGSHGSGAELSAWIRPTACERIDLRRHGAPPLTAWARLPFRATLSAVVLCASGMQRRRPVRPMISSEDRLTDQPNGTKLPCASALSDRIVASTWIGCRSRPHCLEVQPLAREAVSLSLKKTAYHSNSGRLSGGEC
jgi:hypothetical protein